MGFWHTGYAEFHESVGLEGFVFSPLLAPRYVCEHCAESFEKLHDLRRHRFEQHPVHQPLLLIRGRPVGGLTWKILTKLIPEDVVVEDASRCFIGNASVPVDQLGEHLAKMGREFVQLELANLDAVSRYQLDFRIADQVDLSGVETAFLRLAREQQLTLDAVARFVQDCRAFPTAMPYCDGICHYLYGVMAKERSPDSGLHQEQYIERYLRASDELTGFERSLASTIRALIAFHFNHFEEAELLAPEGGLRHAAGAFANLLQGMPWHYEMAFAPRPGGAAEDLLTDQETVLILEDASRGLVDLKASTDQLESRLRNTPVGYDRLKRALLTAEALASRDDDASQAEARRLAREFAGQTATRNWGEAMLQRLRKP